MEQLEEKNLSITRTYGEKMDRGLLKLAIEMRLDTYDRDITEEERVSYGESVIEASTKLQDLEEEKKATMKMFSDDIKQRKTDLRETLKTLRSGAVKTSDTIHVFHDFENAKVHEYNSLGERTALRRMNDKERQTRINSEE